MSESTNAPHDQVGARSATTASPLASDWNRPGQFLGGPFHKWSTVNLVSGALGILFLIAFISAYFAPVSTTGVSGEDLDCGSPASRNYITSQPSLHSEILGFYDINASERGARNNSRCFDAIEERRAVVPPTGLLGAGLLLGSTLFGALRDSKSTPWGALEKKPTLVLADKLQSGTGVRRSSVSPAGWYPDQVDPALVRWFDGTNWTGATLPIDEGPGSDAPRH